MAFEVLHCGKMNVNATWRIVAERGFVWLCVSVLYFWTLWCMLLSTSRTLQIINSFPCKYKEREVLVHFLVAPILLPSCVIWVA